MISCASLACDSAVSTLLDLNTIHSLCHGISTTISLSQPVVSPLPAHSFFNMSDIHPSPMPNDRALLSRVADYLHKYPDGHPVQIALRTYALGAFLSLSTPVMTFIISSRVRKKGIESLLRAFRRELGVTGFAFAMTTAVGGGAAARMGLDLVQEGTGGSTLSRAAKKARSRIKEWLSTLEDSHKTFLCYTLSASVAIALLQYPTTRSPRYKGRHSATLDLTLLLVVRALDSIVRSKILPSLQTSGKALTKEERERVLAKRQKVTMNLDAFVFWACSARYRPCFTTMYIQLIAVVDPRIMWCFCYEPHRYVLRIK